MAFGLFMKLRQVIYQQNWKLLSALLRHERELKTLKNYELTLQRLLRTLIIPVTCLEC